MECKTADENVGRGSLHQIAAVGLQDDDLYAQTEECNPCFKIKYKRHSHMSSEELILPFKTQIQLNSSVSSIIVIPETEHNFITNMYIHINIEQFMRSSTGITGGPLPYYIKNNFGIRCIKRLKIYTPRVTLCDIDSDGLYILLNALHGSKPNFRHMIGDYDIKNSRLISHVASPHMYIPVPLWFAEKHKEPFPLLLLDNDTLRVEVEFEQGSKLLEYNPDTDFKIQIVLSDDGFNVKLEILVDYDIEGNEQSMFATSSLPDTNTFAELLVEYIIPTDEERTLIREKETHEYIVPVIKHIKDEIQLTQNINGKGSSGISYPSIEAFNLPIKLLFMAVCFDINNESVPFTYLPTTEIRINDRIFNPLELEIVMPFYRNYAHMRNVYSFCSSLEPKSGHPSGQINFVENDYIRIKTSTLLDDIYTKKYVSTYALCYNVYSFHSGMLTSLFM